MSRILRRLQDAKFVEFAVLFVPQEGVAVLIVTFLAILELTRESLVEVAQNEAYAPIYVKLRGAHLAVVE
jgi:segregation and condensation protein A